MSQITQVFKAFLPFPPISGKKRPTFHNLFGPRLSSDWLLELSSKMEQGVTCMCLQLGALGQINKMLGGREFSERLKNALFKEKSVLTS